MLRTRALAVHAYLSLAHDPEYPAAWNAGQKPHQELVEARACGLRIHLNLADAGGSCALVWHGHVNFFVRYCFYSGLASILARPPGGIRARRWSGASKKAAGMLVGPPHRGHRNWADKFAQCLRRVSPSLRFPGAP